MKVWTRRSAMIFLAGLAGMAGAVGSAWSQVLRVPDGFVASEIAKGLSHPTALAFSPDGRIFLCEKGGRVRVIRNGALLPAPFATVTVLLRGTEKDSEAGLLGIALHPHFADTPYVYVFYSATTPETHNRISRFTVKGGASGDVSDSTAGETVIFEYENSGGWNHNGGAIHFGPDGKLYAAHGDQARGDSTSQHMTTLLGKIIRMNPVPGAEAQVPSDNPFVGTATGVNRLIYALGLRNPFTFAFQPGTGRMFINDVGQATYEEIDEGKPGRNFGWPGTEGPFTAADHKAFTAPVFYYGRSGAVAGNTIVGGTFYNPENPSFPSTYAGKYFFGDFPFDGWIRYLDPDHPETSYPFAQNSGQADLAVGPDGALYYTDHDAGKVIRIGYGATGTRSAAARGADAPRPVIDLRAGLRIFDPSHAGYYTLAGRRL
jgi:glucose/arabinose dehydrogenase